MRRSPTWRCSSRSSTARHCRRRRLPESRAGRSSTCASVRTDDAGGPRHRRSPTQPRRRGSRGRSRGRRAARALLADDDALEGAFADALALHARTPDVFETARTELAYGGRLRRTRPARARTRASARSASRRSTRLGARPWADSSHAPSSRQPARPPAAASRAARRADAAGAPGLAACSPTAARPGSGRGALPQPEDDRVPPAQRLPEARDPFARRVARCGSCETRRLTATEGFAAARRGSSSAPRFRRYPMPKV